MQNTLQKLWEIILEKPDILSEKWELWPAPTAIEFNICWNFPHLSTYKCLQKGVHDFFWLLLLFRSAKIKKIWFLDTRFLHFYW